MYRGAWAVLRYEQNKSQSPQFPLKIYKIFGPCSDSLLCETIVSINPSKSLKNKNVILNFYKSVVGGLSEENWKTDLKILSIWSCIYKNICLSYLYFKSISASLDNHTTITNL